MTVNLSSDDVATFPIARPPPNNAAWRDPTNPRAEEGDEEQKKPERSSCTTAPGADLSTDAALRAFVLAAAANQPDAFGKSKGPSGMLRRMNPANGENADLQYRCHSACWQCNSRRQASQEPNEAFMMGHGKAHAVRPCRTPSQCVNTVLLGKQETVAKFLQCGLDLASWGGKQASWLEVQSLGLPAALSLAIWSYNRYAGKL